MGDRRLWVAVWWLWAVAMGLCVCQEQQQGGSFMVSSFRHPATSLGPYEWSYMRVELPSWFSSLKMTITSDVDIGMDHMKQLPKSTLPVICIKDGSPPLPDVSDTYLEYIMSHFLFNGTLGVMQNIRNVEQCIPFQQNLTVTLTNEQVSSGVWYLGFFNGLGSARTQSKMISRGHTHMFRTSIDVEGCATSTIWGPYCNLTFDMIPCSQSSITHSRNLLDVNQDKIRGSLNDLVRSGGHLEDKYHLLSKLNAIEDKQVASNSSVFTRAENLIACNGTHELSCLTYGELKFYFLDIVDIASQLKISASDFRLNETSSIDNRADFDGILLMCYARYNAMPLRTLHDCSADISREALIVKSPGIGRWYIAVQTVIQTTSNKVTQDKYAEATMCFSIDWEVHECLNGHVGVNCTWKMHMLQRISTESSSFPLESYYLPVSDTESYKYADFSLELLLSNSSVDNVTWTYFMLDVPHGAAGANMHIQLTSYPKVNYDMYFKYGGIASMDNWDYYSNSTGSNNGSMFLAMNDSSKGSIDLYILYAREGTWCIGLKHPYDALYKQHTTMYVSLEGCPRSCSSHGDCQLSMDQSGSTFYGYCSCDRDHGGIDCSDELVSHEGHTWHSVFLIASNIAAILPAFWALRQKALAEWVVFTSSGISSGLYHSCDVGTWCVLTFRVLQFMDFWLSFMAVVSTFVYMAAINEASKRAILMTVAILTALLAVSGATRSANIFLVITIGALGLLIGWLLEFYTANRSLYFPAVSTLLVNGRWQNIRSWFWDLMRRLHKRYRWRFMPLGFILLASAGTSWKLETGESYWIWHSLWHITIYTSSFFFLCSTSGNNGNGRPVEYELTRQDSPSRTI